MPLALVAMACGRFVAGQMWDIGLRCTALLSTGVQPSSSFTQRVRLLDQSVRASTLTSRRSLRFSLTTHKPNNSNIQPRVQPSGFNWVHLDHCHMGVGGDDSWSPTGEGLPRAWEVRASAFPCD